MKVIFVVLQPRGINVVLLKICLLSFCTNISLLLRQNSFTSHLATRFSPSRSFVVVRVSPQDEGQLMRSLLSSIRNTSRKLLKFPEILNERLTKKKVVG
jgi:hypothetical protein